MAVKLRPELASGIGGSESGFDVVLDFEATGDGVTDTTTGIQAAIDAAAVNGGEVFFPEGRYKVTALTLKTDVALLGSGQPFTGTATENSWLVGTAGSDVITMDGVVSNVKIEKLGISGGDRGIVSPDQTVWFSLDDVAILGPVEECISARGFCQQWRWRNVDCAGGKYGFRIQNLTGTPSGASNRLDKCEFTNVRVAGASLDGIRIEVLLSNSVNWTNTTVNSCGNNGIILNGGLREWVFNGLNFERNAKDQGAGGGLLYDNIRFESSVAQPADIVFIGFGGSNGVSGDEIRYDLNADLARTVTVIGGEFSKVGGLTNGKGGISDLNGHVAVFGAFGDIVYNRDATALSTPITSFPTESDDADGVSNVSSPLGKSVEIAMLDSLGTGLGTYGSFSVRKNNANRDVIFTVDEDGDIQTRGEHIRIDNSSTGVYAAGGSPEGVITADPGSIYLNKSGGAGAALYVKESGSGNTGWVAK